MRRFPTTRLRRNREEDFVRRLVRENRVSADDLIYPMFVIDGSNTQTDIPSMPGISRLSVDLAVNEAKMLFELGLPAIALFPNVDAALRTLDGAEAYNDQGLVPTASEGHQSSRAGSWHHHRRRSRPLASHGQDGIVNADGYVENDITVEALRRQASVCAAAGACHRPVGYDGRPGRRDPRAARPRPAHQHPNHGLLGEIRVFLLWPFSRRRRRLSDIGNRQQKTYQMDSANSDEALQEVALDIEEGADMVMVKPGQPYLDVIRQVKDAFQVPTLPIR